MTLVHTCDTACDQTDKQYTQPARPGVVSAAHQVEHRVLLALDDVPVAHSVSRDIPLPVDGVEVLILTDTWDVVCVYVCTQTKQVTLVIVTF